MGLRTENTRPVSQEVDNDDVYGRKHTGHTLLLTVSVQQSHGAVCCYPRTSLISGRTINHRFMCDYPNFEGLTIAQPCCKIKLHGLNRFIFYWYFSNPSGRYIKLLGDCRCWLTRHIDWGLSWMEAKKITKYYV